MLKKTIMHGGELGGVVSEGGGHGNGKQSIKKGQEWDKSTHFSWVWILVDPENQKIWQASRPA